MIFGGSQGAVKLNDFIEDSYGWFSEHNIQIIHVLGDRDYRKKYNESNYHVVKNEKQEVIRVEVRFINDMKQAYSWADRVISRAGGPSIAELVYYEKTALLVPFSFATDNHQYYNARIYCSAGYGHVVSESKMSVEVLETFFKTDFKPQGALFSYAGSWKSKLDGLIS